MNYKNIKIGHYYKMAIHNKEDLYFKCIGKEYKFIVLYAIGYDDYWRLINTNHDNPTLIEIPKERYIIRYIGQQVENYFLNEVKKARKARKQKYQEQEEQN